MIASTSLTADSLRAYLPKCGYDPSLIDDDRVFTDVGQQRTVKWAAFSQRPHDARSACLAAIDINNPDEALALQYRHLGAPTLFACTGRELQWYGHDSFGTRRIDTITARDVPEFFARHSEKFAPQRIYRAKTTAKFEPSYQLSFVDAALMPLLEQGSGEWLGRQVESLIATIHGEMLREAHSKASTKWVFQSVFWLLAARMLHDKAVPSFKRINIADPNDVFDRVGRHYNAVAPPLASRKHLTAIEAAAKVASEFPSLVNITTESLAYIYENTFVTQEVRDALGTHRTPSWLVDYILWQLAPWIDEIPIEDRHVFEPGCGHSPFLVAALRFLRQFSALNIDEKGREKYLRSHIHGIETDDFAREIGRLSLTLADVPNPDGWDLIDSDMFAGNDLAKQIKRARIVLSNPPFENFTEKDRRHYKKQPGLGIFHNNKAAELFSRVVRNLPAGGVFGLVLPDSVLSSSEGRSFRTELVREYELREVCLFPDKLFENSEIESAIVLGRRRNPSMSHSVFVRRVHDWDMKQFEERLEVSTESSVPQSSFLLRTDVDLRLPDLHEVWDYLHSRPRLGDAVDVQKGFEFKSRTTRQDNALASDPKRKGWSKAYLRADDAYPVWASPTPAWIRYSSDVKRDRGGGAEPGIPQVVLNHVRVSRKPWRLKPFIDSDGCPVTSNFLVLRPKKDLPLSVLWGILLSPIANAYAFSVTSKKHVLRRHLLTLPLPDVSPDNVNLIEQAAIAFRDAASALDDGRMRASNGEATVEKRLLELDAAVLEAYDLPPGLEQQLLAIFSEVERPGVGCRFTSYPQVPTTVTLPFHLRLLLPRFHELVDLRLVGRIKRQQLIELEKIEGRFDAYEEASPNDASFRTWMRELDQRHTKAASKLDAIEAKLKKRAGGGGV